MTVTDEMLIAQQRSITIFLGEHGFVLEEKELPGIIPNRYRWGSYVSLRVTTADPELREFNQVGWYVWNVQVGEYHEWEVIAIRNLQAAAKRRNAYVVFLGPGTKTELFKQLGFIVYDNRIYYNLMEQPK